MLIRVRSYVLAFVLVASGMALAAKQWNRQVSTLTGKLVSPAGSPIAGAKVILSRTGTWEVLDVVSAETNAEGKFEFANLPGPSSSIWQLRAEKDGAIVAFARVMPWKSSIELKQWESAELTVTLVGPDGKPAEGVELRPNMMVIRPDQFFHLQSSLRSRLAVKTDASGKAVFRNLPLGSDLHLGIEDERYANLGYEDSATLEKPANEKAITLRPGAVVSGRVLDANGKPVANVNVAAQSSGRSFGWGSTKTDAEGRYKIVGLEEGAYNIALGLSEEQQKQVTARAHENVIVKAGDRKENLDFRVYAGATIKGVVKDLKGRAVKGAHVGIYGPAHPRSSPWVQGVIVDASGRYETRVPAGEQYVYISGVPGMNRSPNASQTVTVSDGETKTVDFQFDVPETVLLKGVVVDRLGKPVQDALVWIVASEPDAYSPYVTTDSDGRFVIESTAGARVRAKKDDYGSPEAVQATSQGELTIKLTSELGAVKGIVKDEAGAPVAGADIQLSPNSPAWPHTAMPLRAKTDASGGFMIKGLPTDMRYHLFVTKEDYAGDPAREIEVNPGKVKELEPLVLKVANSFIEGVVLDENEKPVAGATVIASVKGRYLDATTDSEGRFKLKGLIKGEVVRLQAWSEARRGSIETEAPEKAAVIRVIKRR